MTSNYKQLNLSLIGEVRAMTDVPFQEVAMCGNPYEAVRLCMRKAGMTEEQWSDVFDKSQGDVHSITHRDQCKGRPRNFDLRWVDMIQRKAGNRAITQYFDMESKGMLNCQRKTEVSLTIEDKARLYDESIRVSA